MACFLYGMNWSKILLLHVFVIISLGTNVVINGNTLRSKRHVGVFFRHFEPIVENPSIFEPIPSDESDSTTVAPENSMNLTDVTTADPKSVENSNPTTPPSKLSSTEVPDTAKTDEQTPNSTNMPNSEMPDVSPTETSVKENTTDAVPVPDTKLNDDDSAGTTPSQSVTADPDVSQKPSPDFVLDNMENLAQQQSTQGTPSADDHKASTEPAVGATSTLPSASTDPGQGSSSTTFNPNPKPTGTEISTSAGPEMVDGKSTESPKDETSTDSNSDPKTTSPSLTDEPDSIKLPKTGSETSTPTQPKDGPALPSETPKPNFRNPKTLNLEEPSATTENVPTTNKNIENDEPGSTSSSPESLDKSQTTTNSPADLRTMCPTVMPRSDLDSPNTNVPIFEGTLKSSEPTTTATIESSTISSSPQTLISSTVEPAKPTGSESESDEDLAAIAQLLDKLNQQKKTLNDQIVESRKALESITDVLDNDKNRKVNDVINRAEEEEIKPLAKELDENPADLARVLDPAVISSANERQKDQTKQWIIARITIPAQFQLMQSYLGLRMTSPNITFPQRVGVMSLFSEAHVDCVRNGQYQLRGPLEAMIVKLACITKSTDPGKLPNGWQPNNYLNRGAMDQIRECSQPDFFYSTNPYGRNTIIFRRIQDNYQEGLGAFQNIQRKIAIQLNLANQEVTKMQRQCERQRQLQMESERIPQLSNQYLPVKQGWNTQEEIPAPSMSGPTGQWVAGDWRPSGPSGYRIQRWSNIQI